MEKYCIFGVLLFSFICIQCKIIVDKIETCDPAKKYPIVLEHKLKTENGVQILEDCKVISDVDLDNNVTVAVEVYTYDDNKWKFLIDIEEPLCTMINKYMKEMVAELVKTGKLSATCPYPRGEYKFSNLRLDFEKYDVPSIPEGRYKIKTIYKDKKNEKILGCFNSESTVE